jgi:hypothetical protein
MRWDVQANRAKTARWALRSQKWAAAHVFYRLVASASFSRAMPCSSVNRLGFVASPGFIVAWDSHFRWIQFRGQGQCRYLLFDPHEESLRSDRATSVSSHTAHTSGRGSLQATCPLPIPAGPPA